MFFAGTQDTVVPVVCIRGRVRGSEKECKEVPRRSAYTLPLCHGGGSIASKLWCPGRGSSFLHKYRSQRADERELQVHLSSWRRARVHQGPGTKTRAAPGRRGGLSCSTREGLRGPRRDSATTAREDGHPLECGSGFSSSFFSSYLSPFRTLLRAKHPSRLRSSNPRTPRARFNFRSPTLVIFSSFPSKSIGRDICTISLITSSQTFRSISFVSTFNHSENCFL